MTSAAKIPKETSYEYGFPSQEKMLRKYLARDKNHWRERIDCANALFRQFVTPAIGDKRRAEVSVLDVGCGIGTFALGFAREGYRAIGVDFDPAAISIAKQLAQRECLQVEFLCSDLSHWETDGFPPIHAAVCFDIFEHLHDDEIGALLAALRRVMAPCGRMIFSTTPTRYAYLWSGVGRRQQMVKWFMRFIRNRPADSFERWVRTLAAAYDIHLLWKHGKSHEEVIQREQHCNPLTLDRTRNILLRAGWEIEEIRSCVLHEGKSRGMRALRHQPIVHTHILGVARLRT